MTPDDDRQLEGQIRATLNDDGAPVEACKASLDMEWAAQLAAYLDNALEAREQETVEAHLASCPSCRRLAMDSAGMLRGGADDLNPAEEDEADPVVPWIPYVASRPRASWPLALAAGLAALVAGLWSSRQGESPESPESPVAMIAEATTAADPAPHDGSTDDLVQRALQGHLAPLPAFESLLDAGQRPVLRHSATDLGPAPLSPRWTLVSTPRPVFAWRATWPGTSGEIFLIDDNETLVATLPFVGSTTPVTRLALPDEVPALEPGRLYAWKVNVQYAENIVASDYVPFQVTPGEPPGLDGMRVTEDDVDGILEHAARLAVDGRFDDALTVLQTLDPAEHGRRAGPLLAAIFEKQQMFPKLERLQRQQMGWPNTPPRPDISGDSGEPEP